MRLELNLENLLDQVESLKWNLETYIASVQCFDGSTLLIIIDDDEENERDENDNAAYATSKGYDLFLSISDLQSIKSNLLEQNPNFKLSELINAVNYYFDNDAFVAINS